MIVPGRPLECPLIHCSQTRNNPENQKPATKDQFPSSTRVQTGTQSADMSQFKTGLKSPAFAKECPMPVDFMLKSNQIPQVDLVAGVRVRSDLLFTNAKGMEKSAIRKRGQRALEKLQGPLLKVLKSDEMVLDLVRAQAPATVFEQMTIGWYIYRITATVLVLTNHRLLHFACDTSGNWSHSARTIGWGELSGADPRAGLLSGTFHLTLRNGKKVKYWGIKRGDIRKLQRLVPSLLAAPLGQTEATGEMPHLCPECFAVLTASVYRCRGCGLVFRDEKTMVRWSLLIPGGGYFYCRQIFLGLADFIAEVVLTLIVIVFLLDAAGILPLEPTSASGSGAALTAIIFGIFLAVEKALTIHHCRRFIREFIPRNQKHRADSMSSGMAAGI
jgi:hypothetical protein